MEDPEALPSNDESRTAFAEESGFAGFLKTGSELCSVCVVASLLSFSIFKGFS